MACRFVLGYAVSSPAHATSPLGPELAPDGGEHSADFGDPSAESAAPANGLPASRPALAPSSLPPALDTLSPVQVRLGSGLQEAGQLSASSSAALPPVRTFEAALNFTVPRIADKPGLSVQPMDSERAPFSFFGALELFGPSSVSPATGQAAASWNYEKLAEAAAAFWHVAGGPRAASDSEWPPRVGVIWDGLKRAGCHASREKTPISSEGDSCRVW